MPECIVPGCSRNAENTLGVRLRKPDTTAIWAPQTNAHVCNVHARSGARVSVIYEATDSGEWSCVCRALPSRLFGARRSRIETLPRPVQALAGPSDVSAIVVFAQEGVLSSASGVRRRCYWSLPG